MFKRKFVKYFIAFWIGSLTLSSIAKANLLGDYVASDKPKKVEQRRSIGSGSRSLCRSSLASNSISLLIPEAEVVHQTTSSRPTFHVFSKVPSSSPVKFTLVNPQSAETIVEKDLWLLGEGIEKIILPESVLEKGKIYLWYLAIPCENDPEQYYDVLSAAVEKVDLPKRVEVELTQASTEREIATIYATNGIWYEALKYAVFEPSSYLKQLLSSVGINSIN